MRLYTTLLYLMLAAMASLQAQELDFIKTDINHIDMNGDDWSCLTDELLNPATDLPDGKFNILHIGDSHIQADYMTTVTRRLLQQQFGNGGRGCIAALKLAGTNQPDNYSFTADASPVERCRLMRRRGNISPGLTGIGVSFGGTPPRKLTVTLHGDDSLFSHVALLHSPSQPCDTAWFDGRAKHSRQHST